MSIWSKFFPKAHRDPAPPDVDAVKREERRMEIREAQLLAEGEKLARERERLYQQGAETRAPEKRRILARKYMDCLAKLRRCEADQLRAAKEVLALMRIRTALEKARTAGSPLLEKFDEAEAMRLDTLLIDDQVSEEMYQEKLDALLGRPPDARAAAPRVTGTPGPNGEDELMEEWGKRDGEARVE